jgi:regulatory protein
MAASSAYLAGLQLLARRELSEAQVRQRLARRGYPPDDVDAAIARLLEERALDDRRVASAIAHTETRVRGRGRLRVKRQIEAAGISASLAQDAVEQVFGEIDADALLTAALDRRMRGRDRIEDDREFQRLYRYLVTQGFDSDRILALLRSRQARQGESPARPLRRRIGSPARPQRRDEEDH